MTIQHFQGLEFSEFSFQNFQTRVQTLVLDAELVLYTCYKLYCKLKSSYHLANGNFYQEHVKNANQILADDELSFSQKSHQKRY